MSELKGVVNVLGWVAVCVVLFSIKIKIKIRNSQLKSPVTISKGKPKNKADFSYLV